MKNLIIGIAGGSGSGKTTLALRLKERFGEDEVRLISHDSYYKRHDELPFEERCKLNYDHPDAFDNALLIYHLQELKAGRAIDCPVYDYADHNRSNKVQHIEPAPVLIVEGILPFVEPELCELFDYKIYVDTDADERILRRILRDVKERGRSLDSVIHQYLTTVKPMHEAFVERCKLNYDHPDAFDNALLIYHLQELKAGRAIDCPVYDYADHNRSNKVQHIEPAPVLIVEGILPFVEPELCELFDYKIYVDTDADERILRRILRDVKERGRSLDSVIHQYLTTVKPMHEAFVEPSKRNADIIVPNGGENSTAVEMLAHHIRSLIEKANMM